MLWKIFFALLALSFAYVVNKCRDKAYSFQRWKVLHEYIPVWGEWIGIESRHNISRRIIEAQFSGHFPGNEKVKVGEYKFAGVRTLVYQSRGPSEETPAIVFFHDGGWVKGVPEANHELLLALVTQLNIPVVAFDYRKAPEHVFPAGFNDCLRGLAAFSEHARSFGINPFRLAAMGEGSGGNLAASVVGSLRRVKALKLSVKLLVLFNPMLQALDFSLPSHEANANESVMTREHLLDYWLLYVIGKTSSELRAHLLANNHTNDKVKRNAEGYLWSNLKQKKGERDSRRGKSSERSSDPKLVSLFKEATSDPRISPILLSPEDISRMPPVYIVTCEKNVLRDEGLAWRNHLLKSGAKVVHHHYDFYHSILNFYSMEQKQSVTALKDFTSLLMRNALL